MKILTSVALAFTSIAASAGMWFGIESPILENVHLAITVSNNVVTAGSTLVLSVSITNSSIHAIGVPQTTQGKTAVPLLDAKLTNAIGKSIRLTPELQREMSAAQPLLMIKAGETRKWELPVIIKKDVEPGDYTVSATQSCTVTQMNSGSITQRHYVIAANPIRIQIK